MEDSPSFEELAQQAMALAVAYRESQDSLPARPEASVQSLRELFDVELPEQGRDGLEVLNALAAAAEQGLVGNTGPNFFGWVMGASHPVGVAAEWLTTTWGQNAGIYATAPAAAVAELVAARWLLDLLDLPRSSSVGITTGATTASTICLAAGRSEVLHRVGFDLESEGMFGAPQIDVFVGDEAHTTIFSSLRYLGFGERNLVRIATDLQGRMLVTELDAALRSHTGPKIVICQAGHINSGDFDSLSEIIPLARMHQAWCHVDGAFGLWARVVPDLRQLCHGIEGADSWAVDGHKWLQVPYDCGFAIVKDPQAHVRAMDTSASYLNAAPGDAHSPSHFCLELSRRARGFAVWAVMQSLGRSGIREMVSRHCRCARHLRDYLAGEPGITTLNDVVLNQLAIGFACGPLDEESNRLTDAVIRELAVENTSFVEGALWQGRKIMRVSVISRSTDIADVERLGDSIVRAWRNVQN